MNNEMSKCFWILDNDISRNDVAGYVEALRGYKNFFESRLVRLVELIEREIPIPSYVYLSPLAAKYLRDSRPSNVFLDAFSQILDALEKRTHLKLGGNENPLLLTVQNEFCGTIRNIGVTDDNLSTLVHSYGQEEAYKLYVGFLETYSNLVLGAPFMDFKEIFKVKCDRETGQDHLGELSEAKFLQFVNEYKIRVTNVVKKSFPESSEKRLLSSLMYIAKACRMGKGDEVFMKIQIPMSQYNQAVRGMVYTCDPFTGMTGFYGKYVSGASGKKSLLEATNENMDDNVLSVKFPEIYTSIKRYLPRIEKLFPDIMEVDFITDDDGKLYFTAFNKADVTSRAAIVNAMTLNHNGMLSDIEAIRRIRPDEFEYLLHPVMDEKSRDSLIDFGSKGVTAAPGTVAGNVFFKMTDAIQYYEQAKKENKRAKVILIADELLIADAPGLAIISGLVTTSSGMASHAAVMARSNGIPCVIGYKGLIVDSEADIAEVNGKKIEKCAMVTLEAANSGRLYLGEGKVQELSQADGIIKDVSILVSKVLKEHNVPVQVMVNINGHKDAAIGIEFGADGVGLCRTENMLTRAEVIRALRNIIFLNDPEKSVDHFQVLSDLQREDFRKIFKVVEDRDIKIRLMDMPLDELIPTCEQEFKQVSDDTGLGLEQLQILSGRFKESNPMLGLRACRFGIIMPEIYDMQIQAIIKAAYDVLKEKHIRTKPGIMFPLVLTRKELEIMRNRVLHFEEKIRQELSIPFDEKIYFQIGTMLELPAAALAADELASISEFFAFGTNDLTQTALGISRNDCENYLPFYIENDILSDDPFSKLHDRVMELVDIAVSRGRRIRKDAVFGICGEQGGDITALKFCLDKGLNYVSCSAYRILPTKLLLAHSALDL